MRKQEPSLQNVIFVDRDATCFPIYYLIFNNKTTTLDSSHSPPHPPPPDQKADFTFSSEA